MENQTDTKGFYKYRTTLRAMSDGVSLLTKNALPILKSAWPLLLIVCVLGAWFSFGAMKIEGCLLTGIVLEWSDLLYKLFIPSLLFCVGLFAVYVLDFTLFSAYIEKGFIPTLKRKRFALCPKITKVLRLLICYVWSLFIILVCGSLVYIAATYTKWSLVATVPICIFLIFWLTNQMVGYMLISKTLYGAISHSLKVTFKGLGSFLTVAVVLGLILGAVSLISLIPSVSCAVIYTKAQLSLAEGDNGNLPGYFIYICFIISMLTTFILVVLYTVSLFSWSMVYGAVDHRLTLKEQEKKQKSLSIVEVPGNAKF